MSEHCHDAFECRPEDLRSALSIHTQKITDSCRDKDCIEDLRVYLTRESQAVLDTAAAAKVRSAELIYTAIDVSPVAFHRSHYTIDLTFYYKVIADAAVGPCRPAAVCGLALFSKRAVLCGENSSAHIFRSDRPGSGTASLPAAVVEVTDTKSWWSGVWKNYIIRQNPPTFNQKKSGDFAMIWCHNSGKTIIANCCLKMMRSNCVRRASLCSICRINEADAFKNEKSDSFFAC